MCRSPPAKPTPAGSRSFRDLTARGLSGVELVTSDAHARLVEAAAATLGGASWQRCRTHYAANLMSVCPKAAWPGVKAVLHSVYDQPDPAAVAAQYDKMLDTLAETLPAVHDHLDGARADVLAFTAFPKKCGARSGRTTPTNDSTAKYAGAQTLSEYSRTVTRCSASSEPYLAEQHDEWIEGRRYPSLDVLAKARTTTTPDTAQEVQALT